MCKVETISPTNVVIAVQEKRMETTRAYCSRVLSYNDLIDGEIKYDSIIIHNYKEGYALLKSTTGGFSHRVYYDNEFAFWLAIKNVQN